MMMRKTRLRQEFLEKRMRLADADVQVKSHQITKKLMTFLDGRQFQTIHLFLPQLNKNEINSWQIVAFLRTTYPDVRIVVPFVLPGTLEMEHYALKTDSVLVQNRWGIPEPEPVTSEKIAPEAIDVVIIPLLAFDKTGYRVGYGGGYYDRFLANCRMDLLKIGVSLFEPVACITDINRFDVCLNACITPGAVWQWDTATRVDTPQNTG